MDIPEKFLMKETSTFLRTLNFINMILFQLKSKYLKFASWETYSSPSDKKLKKISENWDLWLFTNLNDFDFSICQMKKDHLPSTDWSFKFTFVQVYFLLDSLSHSIVIIGFGWRNNFSEKECTITKSCQVTSCSFQIFSFSQLLECNSKQNPKWLFLELCKFHPFA